MSQSAPDDAFCAGYHVFELSRAVSDLERFTADELAPELAELEQANARIAARIASIIQKEASYAATASNR